MKYKYIYFFKVNEIFIKIQKYVLVFQYIAFRL